MKASKKCEIETKRLYRFEEQAKCLAPVRKQRTLHQLQAWLNYVWKNSGYDYAGNIPKLKFGKGLKGKTGYMSFYQADGPRSYIELAPGQHDRLTLLHELLHHIGYPFHNEEFLLAEIDFLNRYCDLDFYTMADEAEKFGLRRLGK